MTLRNVMKETLHCREELPLYLTVCVGEWGRLAAPPQPCLHTLLYPRHCGLPAVSMQVCHWLKDIVVQTKKTDDWTPRKALRRTAKDIFKGQWVMLEVPRM